MKFLLGEHIWYSDKVVENKIKKDGKIHTFKKVPDEMFKDSYGVSITLKLEGK